MAARILRTASASCVTWPAASSPSAARVSRSVSRRKGEPIEAARLLTSSSSRANVSREVELRTLAALAAHLAFLAVLQLAIGHRLPLHIARVVAAARAEWLDVVHDVTRATPARRAVC